MNDLSATRLREVISYDPETGLFRWERPTSNRVAVGEIAGCLSSTLGYIVVRVDGHMHQAHRLAFLWMTGRYPRGLVDHINRDRTDNRWINLREADYSQNAANSAKHTDNSLGFKGVHIHQQTGRYRAQLAVRGKRVSLGLFDTAEQAHAAYLEAARAHFGAYANGDQ